MPILAPLAPLQEQLPGESVILLLPPQLYTVGVQDLVARLPEVECLPCTRSAGVVGPENAHGTLQLQAGAPPLFLYAPGSAYTVERMIAARLTTIREISGTFHPRMNLTRF
jgi:hypothetical protein